MTPGAGRALYGLGAVLAMVVSYGEDRSILWAIIHGVLSWLYVLYAAVAL